tara:strand:- start:320 stop:421 length:102 start_codon:yes stop_codon:yes gene_type:complete
MEEIIIEAVEQTQFHNSFPNAVPAASLRENNHG